MKPLLASLCLVAAASFFRPCTAPAQSGVLLRTFDIRVGKLLPDPNRPRLYATMPADNSLAVIDTNTNSVVAQFFIGSNPSELALSRDGKRLYVANAGSTTAAIGVVDLDSLTTLPSIAAPFAPAAVVAGLEDRLYVLAVSSTFNPVAQINAATGETQKTFGYAVADNGGFLKISPDGKILYFANYATDSCAFGSADVSTSTPSNVRRVDLYDTFNGNSLTLSHDGNYFVYPKASEGNVTKLIPTSDLAGSIGSFPIGANQGPAAFNADDALLYQIQVQGGPRSQNEIRVFDTSSFAQVDAFPDPRPGTTTGNPGVVTSMFINKPNGYLYMATVNYIYSSSVNSTAPNNLVMISTRKSFFNDAVALSDGFYYLKLENGVPFGYYNFNFKPFLYHVDLGFEYPFFGQGDEVGSVYLYDFASETFWYTSTVTFPYLYDFTLNAWLYYFSDPNAPGRYNTNGVRYFYNFNTGEIITK